MWPFKKRAKRADAWSNSVTGLGTSRDKRVAAAFGLSVVPDLVARDLWRGNDVAARIIEVYPREALRAGFCVKVKSDDVEDSKELQEDVDARLEELGAQQVFLDALCYERAYGGCAIWPVLNDQQADLAQPLNPERAVDIRALHLFEPRELKAKDWYDDPADPKIGGKFGLPRTYRCQPSSPGGGVSGGTFFDIHESRLIVFPGPRISRQQLPGAEPGWGDSVLTRVLHVIRDFEAAFDGASHLLTDMSQGVFSMSGLIQGLAQNPDGIKDRMETMDMMRSVARAIVLDKETDETFERVTTSLEGLPALLDRFMLRLAAAADMPATLLMGMSPAGFNATGESDRAFFYDRVDQLRKRLRPKLEQLVRQVFLAPDGPTSGQEPDVWCVEFPPLQQTTDKERAEIRKLVADTDAVYLDRAVLSPTEVRSHFSGDEFSVDVQLDPDFDRVLEAKGEIDADAMLNPPPVPMPGGVDSGAADKSASSEQGSTPPGERPTNGES